MSNVPLPVLPKADFSADVQQGDDPLTVVFTDASTGEITGRVWSFGDGTISLDQNPTKVFTRGFHTVMLTVWNAAGQSQKEYRIDVNAAATIPDTNRTGAALLDLIPSVRALLRDPSDLKLHYLNIVEVVVDLLRGYARDLSINKNDAQTDETPCVLSFLEGNNYLLTVDGTDEIEPISLKFRANNPGDFQGNDVWYEITGVPYDYYSDMHLRQSNICSFYGGLISAHGTKVKINVARELIEKSSWKVVTKLPLLQILTLATPVNLATDFLAMLKVEAAYNCMPMIKDDSKEFVAWADRSKRDYMARIVDWRRRWDEFTNSNTEPDTLPKIPANDYRNRGYRTPRYTVERRQS